MGYDRNKALEIARGELGYHEKASNSQLDDKTANSGTANYTKYARDLDAIGFFYNGPKQGFAYCDVGYDWTLVKAFGAEAALKLLCQPRNSAGAGCYYSAMYYRQRGQFHGPNTVPQPGDQIFFTYKAGEVSHTGMVESVSGNQITCIEFNTSDQVARRYYTVGQSSIYGYGRPDWEMDGAASPAPAEDRPPAATAPAAATYKIELPFLREGMKDTKDDHRIARVQTLLIARGYFCGGKIDKNTGKEIPDGEFGPTMKKAVSKYQADNALTVDGEIGSETMTTLLK